MMDKKKMKYMKLFTVLLALILCMGTTSLGTCHFEKTAKARVKNEALEIDNVEKIPNNMAIGKAYMTGVTGGFQIGADSIVECHGYYMDSYVFLLGWNKSNEKTKKKYSVKADFKLPDQSVITVYFDDSYKSAAKDEKFLAALENLLEQIKKHPKNSKILSWSTIVMRALYVGPNLKQVAEKYYSKKDLWVFSSVFPELDIKLQNQYVKKAYEDGKISVFAVGTDNLNKEEIMTYAKKAYEDKRIDFFSVLSDKLSKDEVKSFVKKAYKNKRIDFFSVLSDKLSKDDLKSFVKKAYEAKRIDYFSVLSDKLSKDEMKEFAKKAYEDKRMDFFSLLSQLK